MRYLYGLTLLALLAQESPRLPDRWVAAFYEARWDGESGEGMTRAGGGDALQDHPESFKDFSYRETSWHRRHLEGMGEAGIDVALCEFAARPAAVDALVLALEAATGDRKRIPRVAPATDDVSVAVAFLGRVPAKFLAAVDKRPVVWLLPAASPSPESLDALRLVAPMYVVGDAAWRPDLAVAAGGAFDGPREMKAVTLGPGYADGTPRLRARDGGAWYEKSWYVALRIKPRVVAIESWNRYHEGSTICPTKEHGGALVSKTRKYAELFRNGLEMDKPKGRYSASAGVSYHLKFEPPNEGLKPLDTPETPCEVVTLVGQKMLSSKAAANGDSRTLAFDIDDSYAYYERRAFEVQLQLLDKGRGHVDFEYDAAAPGKGQTDATRRTLEPFYFTDSGNWATATFTLPEAAFANRQEGGSDFRLVTKGRGLTIRWIQVRAK